LILPASRRLGVVRGTAGTLLVACGAAAASPSWAALSIPVDSVLQAIERVESGGDPLTIRDNSDNRSIYPQSREQAVAAARELLSYDHNIDIGAMQVNRIHFDTTVRQLGFGWERLFEPQVARLVARVIFNDIYARVASRLGVDDDVTLWRAVGCYNGGEKVYTYVDNVPYQAKVMAQLGLHPLTAFPRAASGRRVGGFLAGLARMWEEPWHIGEPLDDEASAPDDHLDQADQPGTAGGSSRGGRLLELAFLAVGSSLALALAGLGGTGLLVRALLLRLAVSAGRQATYKKWDAA
jgi:hypothetical protein